MSALQRAAFAGDFEVVFESLIREFRHREEQNRRLQQQLKQTELELLLLRQNLEKWGYSYRGENK